MKYFKYLITHLFLLLGNILAQSPPSDFELAGTTGSVGPWGSSETITIYANGQVNFFSYNESPSLQTLMDTNFTISVSQIRQIWQSVQNNNFFSLNTNYQDTDIHDGSYVLLKITANGNTKQVKVKNSIQQEIIDIINSVNSNMPENLRLEYFPPEKINVIPTDPCNQSSSFSSSFLKEYFPEKYDGGVELSQASFAKNNADSEIPHGGVEIGYKLSLDEAIQYNRASLRSKGVLYGDAVSIKGYNTKDTPLPDSTIYIKIFLEFYGPCDNPANESKIKNEILNKWSGLTTSDGKPVKLEIVPLSNPGAASPPGTPGFNNIKIECGEGRSFVDPLGTPNSDGVVSGSWYASETEGIYGHEVGHVLGLEDKYIDWIKQPNGDWKNSVNAESLSNEDFMDYYNNKHGTNHPPSKFDKVNKLSVPIDEHENDLMASGKQPLLQSDIDKLAAMAGLIIEIDAGDILANPSDRRQNLIVTHTGDLFLNPGEIRTLNGIYAACINQHRTQPNLASILNVAPPLDKWNGIFAAQDLLKLVQYIDSINYHCGQFQSQYAIWRITDNYITTSEEVNALFEGAGINTENKIYNFPEITNNSDFDTVSQTVIPDELFYPDFNPKIIQSEAGKTMMFNVDISKPSGFNFETNYSWFLETPDESSTKISAEGSFIPDKTGIYKAGITMNISDPENNISEYTPESIVYGIVPGMFTETFEYANLERFHWNTYGYSKWKITNTEAMTGNYSVKPDDISADQSATLAITMNLSNDTSIAFGVKMLTNSGRLNFKVDSNLTDSWNEVFDWQFFEYKLDAGEHKLMWEFLNYYDRPASVWLDNIFFPENSVVTGVENENTFPLVFKIYQNYPNPFNPATKIKYSIPAGVDANSGFNTNVQLKVYDVLGREVATLVNENKPSGNYEVLFDASNLPSGIYFYKLQAGSFNQTRKMILLK